MYSSNYDFDLQFKLSVNKKSPEREMKNDDKRKKNLKGENIS